VTLAYVGLGANLGPREITLLRAVDLLAETEGVEVRAVSQLRETAPVGVVEQPLFLNGAVALDAILSPRELLDRLLEIERGLGRVRDVRWGPRIVDLDLLVYGDQQLDEPGLRIPHPRLHERRFALEPLAELDPDLVIPGQGPVSELLAALD
jgi:2-amino-4-hydroxy-6-hydroxymethyldihydropteridine diphosphokinase